MDNIHILAGTIYIFPWSYFFVQMTGALFGPFAFYYLLVMMGKSISDTPKWMTVISILILLFGFYLGIDYYFLDADLRVSYLESVLNGPYPDSMIIYSAFLFLHQLIYFTVSYLYLRKFEKESKNHLSSLEPTKLTYLYRFVGLLWGLTLVTVLLYLAIGDTTLVEYIYLPLVLIIINLFIIYYAFHSNSVFTSGEYQVHKENVDFNEDVLSASDSDEKMTEQEEDQLFLQIVNVINENNFYKRPDFSIDELADFLDKPVYRLTRSLNENSISFYELVRKTRVQKAKELLKDENNPYSIEGIGYEVGFNSRAAFYRAFQKYEQKKPSDYTKKEI